MSLDDYGIDIYGLEKQVEEALEAEYQRGLEDGADEAEFVYPSVELDALFAAAEETHRAHHVYGLFPMRQCAEPLCVTVTRLEGGEHR